MRRACGGLRVDITDGAMTGALAAATASASSASTGSMTSVEAIGAMRATPATVGSCLARAAGGRPGPSVPDHRRR